VKVIGYKQVKLHVIGFSVASGVNY